MTDADESNLSSLVKGLRFADFKVSDEERIVDVYGLLRPADRSRHWYSATSGDHVSSLSLMWSTFISLQADREQMETDLADVSEQIDRPAAFSIYKTENGKLECRIGVSTKLEHLALARLTRNYLMNSTEDVPIAEIVDVPMLLGPSESGEMPTELDYALLVFAIESEDGDFRWAYRTSGPINRLELIGALDLEIFKLRRTLTEFE